MTTDLLSLLPGSALTADTLPDMPAGRLVPAALLGIAVLVLLIVRFKLHPFLSLTLGSLTVGAVAGVPMADVLDSFTKGFGSTAAGVGILIALGAMFGKLLADSGGADEIVDTIIGRSGPRTLPWAMAGVGAIIGLPMFFEIGLVLLMPVIFLVARRSGLSLVRVGIPALAGLSAMHGLVPPHPGPLVAIDALKADLGVTLGLGIIVAIPTIAVAGPWFARLAARWVDVPAPELFEARESETGPRPSFAVTMLTVLTPVVLMMGKALADILADKGTPARTVLDFLGTPLIALLIAVILAMFTLGRGAGMGIKEVGTSLEASLGPIAGIILIVAAGGGFKQTLVDTGIGQLVADWIAGSGLSVLLLAWLVAVLIRLATGSATVATVTASGILAPLAAGMPTTQVSLMVLAIGAGSVFFSHVNDAGFWLVKEYFGLKVGQTIKSWSVMETILSVTGLVLVLLLDIVV
ncbi:gluconate:H+ symporter, GntP family protein [Terrabacter tumescens]|uniref:Gluconate:H+ symporter, GntP family protein n=1 Tax=Terrabacter tumescens TaxID=60443 RepID=A0ABQ2HZ71_9MICO|nr:gluconate:H+ symporter [Terrabacter tumescens]GGM95049.1 gluconate:H+ symporter, GntP family protein [Terrabacter tumescens]